MFCYTGYSATSDVLLLQVTLLLVIFCYTGFTATNDGLLLQVTLLQVMFCFYWLHVY